MAYLILHADASSKNGYSSWVCKSSMDDKFRVGVIKTMSTAAAEVLAVVKGLENISPFFDVFVISDCATTAKIIQEKALVKTSDSIVHRNRKCLLEVMRGRNVEAIWVNSKNHNREHREVDEMSKIVLNEFLKGGYKMNQYGGSDENKHN